MSLSRPNPTAGRLILAARLRRLRLNAGKTPEEAARELMGSTSKISRIETGERAAVARDIRDLGRFYRASEEEIAELQNLAVEARRKGWWADYSVQDDQAATFLGLETAAIRLDMLETLRWPGLLQTPAVTRALMGGLRPVGELSDQLIADQVSVRQKRQERFIAGELAMHAIVDEAMFRRPLGDGVVAAQVVSILEMISLPNLTFQVVPFSVGSYPGLDGTFQLLEYPAEFGLSPSVYVEGLLGNYIVDNAAQVEHYKTVFRSVAKNNALTPDESRAWLTEIHRKLE